MKQFACVTLLGVATAVDVDARLKLSQHAPFHHSPHQLRDIIAHGEYDNNGVRQQVIAEPQFRMGDELIHSETRAATAAMRDPVIALEPATKPFYLSPKDKEPIDPENKTFKSPVFLTDPEFTEPMMDEEIKLFRGNDWAGWNAPRVYSKFPFIRKEV